MASCDQRFPFKWELRPVPVYTVNQNIRALHAKFLAFKASCSSEKVEDFAQRHALPKVYLKGEGNLSCNEELDVTISSSVGTFGPERFTFTGQDLQCSSEIYWSELKLNIENPMIFDLHSPMDLSIKVGGASDDCSVTVQWHIMNGLVINADIGFQQNHYYEGNSYPSSPPRTYGHDSCDSPAFNLTTSTPAPTPDPASPSPPLSDTSSPYYTPPESLESTPPKPKIDLTFSPIENSACVSPDSGISSLLSNLSLPSPSSQSLSPSPCLPAPRPQYDRSDRGSESDVAILSQNTARSLPQTPKKSCCHSVPSTPRSQFPVSSKRRTSNCPRRALIPNAEKKDLGERPPWKP